MKEGLEILSSDSSWRSSGFLNNSWVIDDEVEDVDGDGGCDGDTDVFLWWWCLIKDDTSKLFVTVFRLRSVNRIYDAAYR